jgi:surfactin synthase thioesterase subunit
MPAVLFASGVPSPTAGKKRPAIAHLPGAAFWEQVRAYGGVPEEVLRSADFRAYFEGILRNDFAAVEGYTPSPDPVDVPLHVFYGRRDMTDQAAESWRHDTSAGLRCHAFDGGHFFLFDRAAEIGRVLRDALAPASA